MNVLNGEVPDQYYAVTSRLTAGGHQRTTMRVVSGCILALGLPAMLAASNPAASDIPGGRAVLAITPLACVALASPWFGYRWPSRRTSMTVVVLGTLFLAVGCSVAINPFSGLLVATAFPFVLGYAALFHGDRLQLLVAVAAAGTIGWLTVKIGFDDVPTALAVSTPVVLINVAVLFAARTIAAVTAAGDTHTDVDPLSGLLTRRAFYEVAGTMIGSRHREDDRYLVVVVVSVDSFAALHSIQGGRGADRAVIAVGQALRDTVRRDAVVGHDGADEFLIADTFTTPEPTPLADRVLGAVAATPAGITASLGVVSKPLRPLADHPPHEVLDEAIAVATSAMQRARGRGGNTAEYVIG